MKIELKNIDLNYTHNKSIFSNLNIVLPDGQLTVLSGPSGSGKTTLLKIIAGLLTPNSGKLLFDGQSLQPRIGMVFQDYALYPHLTVLNNIAFPLKMAKIKKTERIAAAKDIAIRLHIDDQLQKYPTDLSGGQKQRVAIARAIVKHPDVLLLDEPLSNLDAPLKSELRDEIKAIQQTTKTTTILVTHDANDALQIADQIVLINNGEIQQVGNAQELYHHPKTQIVAKLVGLPQINLLPTNAVKDNLTGIPEKILKQSTTIGIRSEAISLSPSATSLSSLTANLIRQMALGHEIQTSFQYREQCITSTEITKPLAVNQTVQLFIKKKGTFLFDANGQCIWTGDAHD